MIGGEIMNWYDNEVTKNIVEKKYLHHGESTFEDMVDRVSSIYKDTYNVNKAMMDGDIFPAGRTLYGAGRKGKQKLTLSNCYILPTPDDTLESICKVDYEMSKIGSMGGGVGLALDKIRPKGSKINNSAKVSDGVSFCLRKYNETGEQIGQNNRKMAIMVALTCSHPDIEEFLHIKENEEKLSAMNISIKFDDKFMEAVEEDGEYELYFKTPHEEIKRKIKAKKFFEEFCKVNADWGDPGCIFIDRVRDYNLLSGYKDYQIDVSNPCAEFFGNGYNSCNLESINLYNCIKNKFEDNAEIDFDKLEKLTRLGVRMLNDCLDYGRDMQPLDGNKKCIDKWRSIGLGVFGVADALIAMKIKYGSKEAFSFISDVFNHINIVALDESCNIAKETKPFSMYDWDKTKESPIIQALLLSKEGKKVYNKIKKYGLANGTLLSIAPNGSISLMAGKLSGGIEPLFKIGYDRTTHSGEDKGVVFRVFARSVEDLLAYKGLPMTFTNDEIKKMFPWIVESQDITPIDRISMQAIAQEYVDNAISSTINLPPETGWEEIYEIYLNAWKQKLKGVTVFVDGCKRGNLLGVTQNSDDKKQEFDYIEPVNRRGVKEIASVTSRSKTACVPKFYTHVSKTDDGHVFEVFTNTSAGCTSNQNTITRLVSLALRSGIKVDEIIKELRANKCPACQALKRRGEKDIADSCGAVVANAIESAYKKEAVMKTEKTVDKPVQVVYNNNEKRMCPECGTGVIRPEAHCWICDNCGASGCN